MKTVNRFEWKSTRVETDGTVGWRAGARSRTAKQYSADLPDWYRFATEPAPCTPAD